MTTVQPRSTIAVPRPPTNADTGAACGLASVIIVTYNGRRYLEACLESVLADVGNQTEVIIVDNASSDDSAGFVRSRWPRVNVIGNGSNLGFAAGCNQGAARAAGDYLVFLNQDTQVEPGWLEGLLEVLEADASVALATSKLVLMRSPERLNTCGLNVHYTGLTFLRGVQERAECYAEPAAVFAVSGASFAMRRSLWETLGGFDCALGMYYEETDLSWRALLAGYSAVYTPASVATHDQRLAPSDLALYYSTRNRVLLLVSNWSVPALLLLTPGLLLAELVEWAYVMLLGWGALRSKLRAVGWLLAHIPAVLQRHTRVQRTRHVRDSEILARCTWRLMPKLAIAGGPILSAAAACNVLFYANYRTALVLCRLLNI